MSGVVLRCPNCGTTKVNGGECEACHEAQVRYYCTNHTPGRWIDKPTCRHCGARFGEPGRSPAAAPPRPPATPAPPTVEAPGATRIGRTSRRPGAILGPWGRRRRSPSPEEKPKAHDEEAAMRDTLATRLAELLKTASRVRRTPGAPIPVPEVDPLLVGRAVGGCFRAALFIGMVLLLAFVALSVLVGGSLLQILGIYF